MKTFAPLLLLIAILVPNSASAETVYGLTVFRDLVTFDSATPGTIQTTTPITGLIGQSSFESVAAIDFRPATGELYALGNAPGNIYRLYTLNPATGAATQIGADITTLTGTFMGFDFNPVADRIRIVMDSDLNLRFHPVTGALAFTDTPVAYAVGDVNVAANPNVVGAAYTNNVAGALTTTLYDIDSNLDVLAIQNPPNNGTLNTVGALGIDFSTTVGFDISGSTGVAYATSGDQQSFVTQFYTVNLATGAATSVGIVGGELLLNDIAVRPVPVPEATSFALAALGALLLVGRASARNG